MPGEDDSGDPLRGRDLLALGSLLVGCVVGFTILGIVVDHYAGCSPVGAIVGVGVGIVAGAIGFVVRVRQALHDRQQ